MSIKLEGIVIKHKKREYRRMQDLFEVLSGIKYLTDAFWVTAVTTVKARTDVKVQFVKK